MTQETKDFVTEQVKALIAAPSCCQEAKDAGNAWLNAVGTDGEAEASKNLVAELEEDIIPIDGLIAFAESAHGIEIFGAEKAAGLAAHAKEIKAQGAVYCDCPACAACEKILSKKAELLA